MLGLRGHRGWFGVGCGGEAAMADYQVKGLFEAMQASKRKSSQPRPAGPTKSRAVAGKGGNFAGGSPLAAKLSRVAETLVLWRIAVVAAAVIVVLLGAWYGLSVLRNSRAWPQDRGKLDVEAVAQGPIDRQVADNPPSDRPAYGATAPAGALRIRILLAPLSNRDQMEHERRKLIEAGIDTVVVQRGSWYYVYAKQTFAAVEGKEAEAMLKRIKALGYPSAYLASGAAVNGVENN
jgi:hypothetical protein